MDYLVKTKNAAELKKYGTVLYESDVTDLIIIETKLSMEQLHRLNGVYTVEENRMNGKLCG